MKFISIVFLLNALVGKAQTDSVSCINQLKNHISYLASDSMKGRSTGSKEEKLANVYVRENWTSKKRKTEVITWNYPIFISDDTIQSQMIGNFINNKSEQTLLIGAHIDHIGLGGKLSKSFGKLDVHNGADDNASGVALLIELQRYYSTKKLPFNILFVAFTGHEIGTYGSAYLSQHLDHKFGQLFCMLNFDMVGRMDPSSKKLFVSCSESLSPSFNTSELTLSMADSTRLSILDTQHFINQGIPSATFTTGMHDDYHRTSDDSEFINYAGMYQILLFFENWINYQAYLFLN